MNASGRKSFEPKNRLAGERSPYLFQHAGNPVDWYPWGEEAFEKARTENRPIFLSIGYSTCYWCHVMERESFADFETAERMNRTVVAIKVDREERPDLDGIYMTAVMLLTGHGGWPMSVFLTPDRKPFFGATYLPRERFHELLEAVHSAWTNRRDHVLNEAERVADAIRTVSGIPAPPSPVLPDPGLIDAAARQYAEMFDDLHGGFGDAPKFPQPAMLELLMSRYERSKEPTILSILNRTLDAMSRGGIHDQIGGGFHRYATDAGWRVPHFEKMLYDQAQLLHAYARGYRLTSREEYRRVCGQLVQYLEREMTDAQGLFHSAQDSEVDGMEGKSYLWTPEELRAPLDPTEYDLAVRVFGIGSAPTFEGRHILHWPDTYEASAEASGRTVPELFADIDTIRSKLLGVRGVRSKPFQDDKSITGWNGLMIEALAYSGMVLQETRFIHLARRAAGALLASLRDADGRLLHVTRGGEARIPAFLDDYGAAILGLLETHRATGESRFRRDAERLGRVMVDTLRDSSGRFRYTDPTVRDLIAETRDISDGAFPSGNSLAVRALTGLAGIGSPEFAEYAAALLRSFAPLLRENPGALPYMLWGLHEFLAEDVSELRSGASVPDIPTTADLLHVEGTLSPDRAAPGEPVEVSVILTLKKGWHVNANPASLDTLLPTTFDVAVTGRKWSFFPRYPPGTLISIGPGNHRIAIYEHQVKLCGTLMIFGGRSEPGNMEVIATVVAQGCDSDGTCLAPSRFEIKLPLSIDD